MEISSKYVRSTRQRQTGARGLHDESPLDKRNTGVPRCKVFEECGRLSYLNIPSTWGDWLFISMHRRAILPYWRSCRRRTTPIDPFSYTVADGILRIFWVPGLSASPRLCRLARERKVRYAGSGTVAAQLAPSNLCGFFSFSDFFLFIFFYMGNDLKGSGTRVRFNSWKVLLRFQYGRTKAPLQLFSVLWRFLSRKKI